MVKIPTTQVMLRFASRDISILSPAFFFSFFLDLKDAQMPTPRTRM